MQTIPETTTTVNFDAALRLGAAQATCRYAGEAARIDRGLVLALNGHVTLQPDGTALVTSAKDTEIVYTVNGHCDCPDAARAPEGRCKHRWAKCLTKRAISRLAALAVQPSRTTGAPQPVRWYASYTRPDGETVQGIATHTPRGYLFAADDGSEYCYASAHALALGGNVAIAQAKRAEEEAAGGLVAIVTGYGKAR